ncbi:MAG TPA: histidine kinase [Microbacterium sp.]|nr:histidine kinase [Microbacterium sp.]
MPEPREIVLGQESLPAEDDLRLPRPPGVIRRFWTRHPLLTDILIAAVALLISIPSITASTPVAAAADGWTIALAIGLALVGCASLVWRRRWPLAVFIVTMLPTVFVTIEIATAIGTPASIIALSSIATYRNVRSCWIAFGVACAALTLNGLARLALDPTTLGLTLSLVITSIVLLLVGALVGVNVGNRRRYLEALIDRSRQLVIERDQQARLAAAAERTRIAREMHDIVSHSLTVVVALAEGAAATTDPARAREADRAVAATAREALGEMRMMLGVLRSDSPADGAPLGPLLDASLHEVVDAAREAGFPVTLTVSGNTEVSAPHRLAVLRIVQEGITNAMRYSHDASFIRARTDYSAERILIVIENDGARSEAVSEGAGWGLQGLTERAANLDGTVTAGMAAPGVWRLMAELPTGGDGA